MRIFKGKSCLLILVCIIGVPLLIGPISRFQVSNGTRSGIIVKLSHRGIVWKTWEGQLMLGSGQSGETWDFSVDSDSADFDKLIGELQSCQTAAVPVSLDYSQRLFVLPWNAETDYLVSDMKRGPTSQP